MTSIIQQILHTHHIESRKQHNELQRQYHESLGSLFLSIITLIVNKEQHLKINTSLFQQKQQQILTKESTMRKYQNDVIKMAFGHHVNHIFQTMGGFKKIITEIQSQIKEGHPNRQIVSHISTSSQATNNSSFLSHLHGALQLDHSYSQRKQQELKQWSGYCSQLKKYLASIADPQAYIELYCRFNDGQFVIKQKEDKIIAKFEMNYLNNQTKFFEQQILLSSQKRIDKIDARKYAILALLYNLFASYPQLFKLFCIEAQKQLSQVQFIADTSVEEMIDQICDLQIDRASLINEFNTHRDEYIQRKRKTSILVDDFNLIKQYFSQNNEKINIFDFKTIQQHVVNQGHLMKIELTFEYDFMPHIFYRPCQIKILPEIPIYRKMKKIAYRLLIQETVQHIYKNYDFVMAKILKEDRYIKQKSFTIDK